MAEFSINFRSSSMLSWTQMNASTIGSKKVSRSKTSKIIQQCAYTEAGERRFKKFFNIECGLGRSGSEFIVNGTETKRGQWGDTYLCLGLFPSTYLVKQAINGGIDATT